MPREDLSVFLQVWGIVPAAFIPSTLITAMFLHGSWSHVIGNMVARMAGPTPPHAATKSVGANAFAIDVAHSSRDRRFWPRNVRSWSRRRVVALANANELTAGRRFKGTAAE